MPTAKEIEEVNSRIAQLKLILDDDLIKNKYNIKFIFEKVNNINCRVLATDYLESCHAKWIGSTLLHFAVEKMDVQAVDILLSHGSDFTIKNSNGSTALHQLIEDQPNRILEVSSLDKSVVNSIVSAHVKYSNFENPVNSNGLSHFHIACAVNNVAVVKGFLQNGVSVDHAVKPDSPIFPGYTPLHFAAKNCAYDVAEILFSCGASALKPDMKKISPLHIVLERKFYFISKIGFNETIMDIADRPLRLFLERESNNNMIDDWGLSYLHVACTLKDSKLAESSLQNVVNINHSVSMDSPLWPGYTSLHFAALCNINTVKLLMKKGADISSKDAQGVTPFDICTKRYKAEDIYTVLTLHPIWKNTMLSDGKTKLTDLVFAMRNLNQFDVFLRKLSKNFNIYNSLLWPGCTPMHLAVIFCQEMNCNRDGEEINMKLLKNLCKHNPTMLSSRDVHGYTPLHLAFRLNKQWALNLLFEYLKVHPNLTESVDEDGLSLVHMACANNGTDVLNRLLSMGSNVNAVYKGKSLTSPVVCSDSTPLHFAVASGSVEAVIVLMKEGANLYARDTNNMTPIHLLLLNTEASSLITSPNLLDSVVHGIGLSHLHVVCWWDQPEIVKRLLDGGANINGTIAYQSSEITKKSELSFIKKYDGYTPLLIAYEEESYDTVEELLKRGADVFVADNEGKALLYRIIENCNVQIFYGTFVEFLTTRIDVQARLKADTGMTALHIACLNLNEYENMNKLLKQGADVNVQIRDDSPILKGYTPLHVVMHVADEFDDDIVDRAIELLVKAGADVTLQTSSSKSAVHMALESFNNKCGESAKQRYMRVNELLETQRDFSVNPVNVGGITHFHVACKVCNVSCIQKFLSRGNVDVDQPIDFFHESFAGYSALHLAAGSSVTFCGASKQLRAVDLLLNHGANVHVEDEHGETPLHECARFGSIDVFERLVRGGADLNARSVHRNTPLYYYLKFNNPSLEGLKLLLRFGCHLNIFDAFTREGYMGVAACKLSYADAQSFFDAVTINFKREVEVDDLGRTAIHNIVSRSSPEVTTATEYATFIGQLSETDCDVDDQDHLGQTALHVAAKFNNFKGIAGLLMAGADVNIVDSNGKSAFAGDFDSCLMCRSYGENTDEPRDEDHEDEQLCKHLQTKKTLAIHVKKLQYCGLDVNKQNEDLACTALETIKRKTTWSEDFLEELETMKNTPIGSHSLTLHDFLSENGAVADYPTMSLMKREAINKFFSLGERESLIVNFPEVSGILQLQYRKAMARPQLVESAKNAITLFIGFRLPEICSHLILILLKNSDLKSLIASTL